jgi:hypothetical protein
MKIYAIAFLVAIGLSGCVTTENHGIELAAVSTDCASEGRQKPIAFDNGAGTTWKRTNTSRWCAPHSGMNPQDDHTFEGSN